jgi:hypothetical protein
MWTKTLDGSFVASDGRVVFVSAERFERDICVGGGCFICGAARDTRPFNDEHIIPEWVLRRFDLFDKKITLPNERPITYGHTGNTSCLAVRSATQASVI